MGGMMERSIEEYAAKGVAMAVYACADGHGTILEAYPAHLEEWANDVGWDLDMLIELKREERGIFIATVNHESSQDYFGEWDEWVDVIEKRCLTPEEAAAFASGKRILPVCPEEPIEEQTP